MSATGLFPGFVVGILCGGLIGLLFGFIRGASWGLEDTRDLGPRKP